MARKNKVEMYVHLVWATWDRLPLIEPRWERRLYRLLTEQATELGCQPFAINGMPNHVHVLLSLAPTQAISDVVKQLKGVSSHFINHELTLPYEFRWQGFYGAFSVSPRHRNKVQAYIFNQKQHHDNNSLIASLEETYIEWQPVWRRRRPTLSRRLPAATSIASPSPAVQIGNLKSRIPCLSQPS